MVSVQEYCDRVQGSVRRMSTRTVSLSEAYRRVASYDAYSHMDLPRFDTAAMDGFAARSEDLEGASEQNPVRIKNVGEILMGQVAEVGVGPGEAVAVPTGGQVPTGADTVVPVERCSVDRSLLTVTEPSPRDANIRRPGEDLRRGELLFNSGRRLGPVELSMLAAIGVASVKVVSTPQVGILSTGNELVQPGKALPPARIYNSNSTLLAGLVARLGARPVDCGVIPDDPATLVARLEAASDHVDVLVTSGGISAGVNDPLRRAAAQGLQVECVKVAMKPGRPQAFGQVNGKPLIGVPGNPTSAFVSFEVFVRPLLSRLMGLAGPEYVRVVLGETVEGVADRVRYVPMAPCPVSGGWVSAGNRKSLNRLASLSQACGLVRLLPGTTLEAGEPAEALLI